jgi:hypothetical protein
MSTVEQDEALDAVGVYLKKYGEVIMPPPKRQQKIKHGNCELIEFSNGHSLCGPAPEGKCTFFSFGINDDPSFLKHLQRNGTAVSLQVRARNVSLVP